MDKDELFEKMLELDSTKAMFNGHDHLNYATLALKRRNIINSALYGFLYYRVQLITLSLQFIIHVKCNDCAQVQVYELSCQVEVALYVGGYYRVYNHVGLFVVKMATYIYLFGRVCRESICAWQIGNLDVVALER